MKCFLHVLQPAPKLKTGISSSKPKGFTKFQCKWENEISLKVIFSETPSPESPGVLRVPHTDPPNKPRYITDILKGGDRNETEYSKTPTSRFYPREENIQLTLFEKVGVYHYYSKFGILSRTKGVKGHTLRVDLQPKCTLVLFPLQRDYTWDCKKNPFIKMPSLGTTAFAVFYGFNFDRSSLCFGFGFTTGCLNRGFGLGFCFGLRVLGVFRSKWPPQGQSPVVPKVSRTWLWN